MFKILSITFLNFSDCLFEEALESESIDFKKKKKTSAVLCFIYTFTSFFVKKLNFINMKYLIVAKKI